MLYLIFFINVVFNFYLLDVNGVVDNVEEKPHVKDIMFELKD